jgi:DNA-binding GntR family transcriptional regulator
MGLRKVQQRLIRDDVLSSLRAAILEGTFQPGERLIETDLSQQLGTSRGPVREALKELSREGLVVIHPYRGAEVTTFCADDIREICVLRTLLEGHATREAVTKATPEDIERLQKMYDQMQNLADTNDLSELVEKDIAFHREICRIAGNKRLLEVWSSLAAQIRLFLILTDQVFFDPDFIVETHKPVLDAMRNQDPDAAAEAITYHLCKAAEAIVSGMANSTGADD